MDVDKDGREEISTEGGNFGDILFIYCYFKILKRTEKINSLVFLRLIILCVRRKGEKQERKKTEFR